MGALKGMNGGWGGGVGVPSTYLGTQDRDLGVFHWTDGPLVEEHVFLLIIIDD